MNKKIVKSRKVTGLQKHKTSLQKSRKVQSRKVNYSTNMKKSRRILKFRMRHDIPSEVYANIGKYLDIKSLSKLSSVSKTIRREIIEDLKKRLIVELIQLENAIQSENERLIQIEVSKFSDMNLVFPNGKTPLIVAIETGNVEIVNIILNNDANVNKRDVDGKPPLVYALELENINIFNRLVRRKANLSVTYEAKPLVYYLLEFILREVEKEDYVEDKYETEKGYLNLLKRIIRETDLTEEDLDEMIKFTEDHNLPTILDYLITI